MYNDFFGLQDTPFSIAPNPHFLYMSERHKEALAHLLYGVQGEGGFVLLTGEVGTGKTTICRSLLEQMPEEVNVAFVVNPKVTERELLATICDELGIGYLDDYLTIKDYVDNINEYLLDAHANGMNTVVIIDEAQNLDIDVLEQLRLLTNLETNERKLLQIILLGQPELQEMLGQPELRQLSQRITARYHLTPLLQDDLEIYIRHRLSVAGTEEKIFEDDAIKKVYALSDGVPRLINVICDRALLAAFVDEKRVVDSEIIARAAREVFGESRQAVQSSVKKQSFVGVAAAFLIGVLALTSGYLMLRAPAEPQVLMLEPPVTQSPLLTEPLADQVSKLSHVGKWPQRIPVVTSEGNAYSQLLKLWRVDAAVKSHQEGCEIADKNGLHCLKGSGSLSRLQQFDRPAVLSFKTAEGRNYFAVLLQLSDHSATIALGERIYDVSVSEIESRWLGDYTLFWKPPAVYREPLQIGDKGPSVDWLAQSMARVEGKTLQQSVEPSLDGELLEQVRHFQLTVGLAPDGVVNENTLIPLNTLLNKKTVPLLTKR